MRSTAASAVRALVTVALTSLVVIVVWDRRGELVDLVEHPPADLAVIAALVVLGHFLNSTEFWLLYRAQGVTGFGVVENWMVFTAGQLGNLLPGQVGSLFKFRYMSVVHGLSYARSGSNYGANMVVTFASSALTGLIGIVVSSSTGDRPSIVLVLAFVTLGATALLVLLVPAPDLPFLRGRPARAWSGFRDGWEELRRQPRVAIAVLLLDVGKYGLVALRFQLAFALLGVHESFAFFLVIAPAAGVAGTIAFTPGGIGFRESFVAAAAVGMGTALDTGLLAATVDRGILLASSVLLGSIGWISSAGRIRRARQDAELNRSPAR